MTASRRSPAPPEGDLGTYNKFKDRLTLALLALVLGLIGFIAQDQLRGKTNDQLAIDRRLANIETDQRQFKDRVNAQVDERLRIIRLKAVETDVKGFSRGDPVAVHSQNRVASLGSLDVKDNQKITILALGLHRIADNAKNVVLLGCDAGPHEMRGGDDALRVHQASSSPPPSYSRQSHPSAQ